MTKIIEIARYKAYINACEKYKKEISLIQKHLPMWKPLFSPYNFKNK